MKILRKENHEPFHMPVLHLSEKQSQHPTFLLLLALAICTDKANTKAEVHKEL